MASRPLCLPKSRRLEKSRRMTIAAGLLCETGIVFGADTDESIGEMKRRVHKIPTRLGHPSVIITGACLHGHLMDTAVERILERLGADNPPDAASVGALLQEIMTGLYRTEFKAYPMARRDKRVTLLVAVKPEKEKKASAWTIDCTSVHKFTKHYEIVGTGELLDFFAAHLFAPGTPDDVGRVAMVQLLSLAKKTVQFVGGESYVHVLRDDGGIEMSNFHFRPKEEDLLEFFLTMGRPLILASGARSVSDEDFERILSEFTANIRWKRKQALA